MGNAFGNGHEVGGRAAPPAVADFRTVFWQTAMVSDTRRKRWWGLVLTGLTGLMGEGRNAEGAEITRRARREKGNSDCWQGHANAPPAVMASVTLRDFRIAFGVSNLSDDCSEQI